MRPIQQVRTSRHGARIWLLGLTIVSVAVAEPAKSESRESFGETSQAVSLTLAEAVRRADLANPDFEILQARLSQQQAGLRVLLSRLLPTAGFSGTYTHYDQGVQLAGISFIEQDDLTYRGDLTVTLLRPRSLGDYLVGLREMEASNLSARHTRSRLTLAVIELYIGLIRARNAVDASRETLARRQTFLVAAQDRLHHGLTNRSEVQRASMSVLDAMAALERSEAQTRLSEQALALVLSLPLATRLELDPNVIPPGFESLATSINTTDHLLTEQLVGGFNPENREDLRAAVETEERDDLAELFTKWLDFLPDVVASAGFTQGPTTSRNPDGFSWQVALRVSFNLYDGGLRYGLMHQQAARRTLHQAEQRANRTQAQSEVRSAALTLQTLTQQRLLAEQSLEIASEYWSDTNRRRDAGLGTMLEVLDAEEQLSAIELRTRNLEEEYLLALWRLVQARGELLEVFF